VLEITVRLNKSTYTVDVTIGGIMIDKLTPKIIMNLQNKESLPSISIYLPMKAGHAGMQENRIRFKNAIRTAKRMTKSEFMPKHKTIDTSWIRSANKILNNTEFWQIQSRGLATFFSDNGLETYRLNHRFSPRIFVGTRLITEPLNEVLAKTSQNYYMLAISQKNTRLFRVSSNEIKIIGKDTVPRSLKKELRLDEADKELQTHMVAPAGNKQSTGFHGHGYYKDRQKILVEAYLRSVSKKVNALLKNKRDPLFVIGTASIVSRYRKLNLYPAIVQNNMHQNVDHLDAKQLRNQLMLLRSN
jgi:hypothetical protein